MKKNHAQNVNMRVEIVEPCLNGYPKNQNQGGLFYKRGCVRVING